MRLNRVELVIAAAIVAAGQFGVARLQAEDKPVDPRGSVRWNLMSQGSGLDLMRLDRIQKELALTAEQSDLMRSLEREARELSQSLPEPPMGGGDFEVFKAKMSELNSKAKEQRADIQRKLATILTPQQLERLNELRLQFQGARSAIGTATAEKLRLTEEQKRQIRAILSARLRGLSSIPYPGSSKDWDDSRPDVEKKILDVLSDEQRTAFNRMRGKAFEFTGEERDIAVGFAEPAAANGSSGGSATTTSAAVATAPSTVPYPRSTVPAHGKTIHWKKTVLDEKFRGEGVAVGDFNHDGKMDIAVGSVYYAAPDWKMHVIGQKAEEFDPHGYSDAFMCYADDLNHDGWTDLIVIGFPGKETFWYENPKGAAGPWKRHLITPVSNNESPAYVDIDGSGQRSLVMGIAPDTAHSDGNDREMAILRSDKDDPTKPWIAQRISVKKAPGTTKFSHGLGVGSIRGNGRNDVIVTEGWWESPEDKSHSGPWTFHPEKFGEPCSHMIVFDFNGDGRNDVLTCSAHNYGIWLHEQTADGWKTREIDKSFSETHSVVLADIAGDGLPGFVTGKRWWAHGPTGDPGAGEPAVLYWFELVRKNGQAEFVRHEIDDHSGVGTQFEVADVNGDGLLDVAIGNKHGVFLFEQNRD